MQSFTRTVDAETAHQALDIVTDDARRIGLAGIQFAGILRNSRRSWTVTVTGRWSQDVNPG